MNIANIKVALNIYLGKWSVLVRSIFFNTFYENYGQD